MNMTKKLKIAVAGAGIGGLVAALALIRKGYDVTVYEQAPELRELGAGLQISANGTRILIALGLREAAVRMARRCASTAAARPGSCSIPAMPRSRNSARPIGWSIAATCTRC